MKTQSRFFKGAALMSALLTVVFFSRVRSPHRLAHRREVEILP